MSSNVARIAALALLIACGSEPLRDSGAPLQLSPERILFGEVMLGADVTERVQLVNVGRSPMNLVVLDLPEGFEVTPSSFGLAAGGTIEVEVRFRPTAERLYSGALRFDSTSGEGGELYVEGRGLANVLEVATTLDFGFVPLGERRELEIPIENLSDWELELALEIVGASSFSIAQESVFVAARQSAAVVVGFRPTGIAGVNANLRIRSCERCVVYSTSLFGQGVGKELTFYPAWLDFGPVAVGQTKPLSFEVRNTGATGLDLVLPQPANIAFTVNPASYPHLSEGSSASFNVTFSPRSRGVIESNAEVEDTAGWALGGVYVRGEAIASLEALPPRLDFIQPAGSTFSQVVEVISLNPSREVRISEYGLVGRDADVFELEGPPAGSSVGWRSQKFTVRYESVESVRHEAELVIETEDSTSRTIRVPIVGEAFKGRCELRPSYPELLFGLLPYDGRLIRHVDLNNIGDDPCFLWGIELEPCEHCEREDFRVIGAPPFEIVEPGEVFTVVVQSIPADRSYNLRRTLQYRFSESADPPSTILLRSTTTSSTPRQFLVDPWTPVEFPETPIGQTSVRAFTIRTPSDGVAGLITSIAMAEGSSASFQMRDKGPFSPIEFGYEGVSIDVVFEPVVADRVYGQVELHLGGTGSADRVRFDLSGTGVIDPELR